MNRDVEHRSVLPDAKQDTLKILENLSSHVEIRVALTMHVESHALTNFSLSQML